MIFKSKVNNTSFKYKEVIPNNVKNCADFGNWISSVITKRENNKYYGEILHISDNNPFAKCLEELEFKRLEYVNPSLYTNSNQYNWDLIRLVHKPNSVEYINTCYCTTKVKDVYIIHDKL
jgi:hypothetical protein